MFFQSIYSWLDTYVVVCTGKIEISYYFHESLAGYRF